MNRWVLSLLILVCALSSADAARGGTTRPPDQPPAERSDPVLAAMPEDATTLCADHTWSSAERKRGACSSHGGIRTWFGPPPKNSTARCQDGTYSRSENSQGACSGHGGIRTWYGKPPRGAAARCRDGSYSASVNPSGSCSHHGGVLYWLKQPAR